MFKSKYFKNCLALFLITLVAGFALAMVNSITSEPIMEADEKARMQAYQVAYKGAAIKEIDNLDEIFEKYGREKASCPINDAVAAFNNDGDKIGYIISATSHEGYGGDVTVAVGISSVDDSLSGIRVISQNETAGLGARCTDEEFQNQFKGKKLLNISVESASEAQSDTEIDGLSGATITSKAVTNAVNAAIEYYNSVLKKVLT